MELLDIYDNEGKPTGRIVERSTYKTEKYNDNEHIAVVQIYIENDNGEFLIEKSAKKTGERYLPASGHLTSGETPYNGIIREVKEELGLDLGNEDVKYMGFFVLDFPVRFIFYLKKNIDINALNLQKEEVESVSYMKVEEIFDLIDNGLMHKVHREILPKIIENK